MHLLLLMTPGMSLKKWESQGYLERELDIYQKLGKEIGYVSIFTYGKNEDSLINGFFNLRVINKLNLFPEEIMFPKKFNKYINYLNDFLSLVFRYSKLKEIDVVKTNQFSASLLGVLIKLFYKKKLVVRMGYYYGHFKNQSWLKILCERLVFNYADLIFVTNQNAQKHIENTYYVKGKVNYFPNYINTDIFKPFNLIKDIDILYVGRFDERKNPFYILKELKNTKYKITFIGRGPLKEKFIKYAEKNNINLSIIDRVGNFDLPKYYNRARFFVLPSKYEGNPKALLEAMACGCVCIISNTSPGSSNVVYSNSNGYAIDVKNEWLATILLKGDSDEISRIEKSARLYILKGNSLNLLARQEHECIKKIFK